MKSLGLRVVTAALICFGLTWTAKGQETQKPGEQKPTYLDTSLPPEQRAADLVHQMTLEEKASQLVNSGPGHPTAECAGLRLVERSVARCNGGRDDGVP